MCSNCYTKVGPFYLAEKPLAGPALRVCGPIAYEKETGKITGRVVECNDRRKALEKVWYGKEEMIYE